MRGRRSGYAWDEISPAARLVRLMRKVRKRADGCWEWTGKRFKNGYGQICIAHEPRKRKYHLAHRLMWELVHGEALGSMKVLHKCDRPWCVRPAHLFKGTTADNMRDMLKKGRGNPQKGSAHWRTRLTESDVRVMRKARANGTLHREIAARFNVSRKQVSVILSGKQWSHVT